MNKTCATGDKQPVHTRHFYISSLSAHSTPVARFAALIRGHWGGCKIRNHWIRDHIWAEDKTRSKNWRLNANLAIVRCALIHLKAELIPHMSWPKLIETCQFKPAIAYQLVANHRAI